MTVFPQSDYVQPFSLEYCVVRINMLFGRLPFDFLRLLRLIFRLRINGRCCCRIVFFRRFLTFGAGVFRLTGRR